MRDFKKFRKYYIRMVEGRKIPRKAKKAIFGDRKSKCQIRKMLNDIHICKQVKTIYDGFGLDKRPFCMKCGCPLIVWSGNRATYPDLWQVGHCVRCGHQVAEADNSPYYHEIYDYLSGGIA